MTAAGAVQRCAAVRAAYAEGLEAGQLAETRLWRDLITSADWENSEPTLTVVKVCERELAQTPGRVRSLLDEVVWA